MTDFKREQFKRAYWLTEEEMQTMETARVQCICRGNTATSHTDGGPCVNRMGEGRFVGSVCAPCEKECH